MVKDLIISKTGREYDVIIKVVNGFTSEKELQDYIQKEGRIFDVKEEDIIDGGEVSYSVSDETMKESFKTDRLGHYILPRFGLEPLIGIREPITFENPSNVWCDTMAYLGNPQFVIIFKDYQHKYRTEYRLDDKGNYIKPYK